MDSKTKTPAAPNPLAAMFQNTTIDKAEKSEFSNSARDNIKLMVNSNYNFIKEGENPLDCVSLEKSVLDGSNVRLQDTEILVLQAPLTAPDDSYTPLLPIIFVTLPRELVERIFLFLDTKSMLTCKLVNREFNETIRSSTVLQYFLACKAVGVVDNHQSLLSYAERLEALKKREAAWRTIKPIFETIISVTHQTASQICRSTEGVYFLTDDNRKDLNYWPLTSFPQDNPRWIRIPGHGPALNWSGTLVNFGTALHEHDLIVNLISSDTGNEADMQRHSLDLILLKFSTGEYHPLARHPRIHVQRSPEVDPWVVLRIVGANIALIVHSDDGTFSDKLFIFDWKIGCRLLEHEAPENPYFDLVFISPELLLVPNCDLSHFEVWHLPPHQLNPKPPMQILSLQMPIISPEYSISHFSCYGEPNPFLHSMPYLPPRPFFSPPENSIIVITLRMSSNSYPRASYKLVMHRRTLLDTIQTWTSPSLVEQQEYLPTWLTNDVTMHQIADPEDGSVGLNTQSKLVSTKPHPRSSPQPSSIATSQASRNFPTSHTPAEPGSSSVSAGLSTNLSAFRCAFLQVPWTKWGPPISRWFQVNDAHARWINNPSNGQICAFSDPNPLDKSKLMVSVADFNLHNSRRNVETIARLRSRECVDNGSNGNNEEGKEVELEILEHKGVFLEKVYMGLKCVVYRAQDEYEFDAVLMDEERLLGLQLNFDGWIKSIKVLYIG